MSECNPVEQVSEPPAPGDVVATPLERGLAALRLEADEILERLADALNDAADDLDRLCDAADDLDRQHNEARALFAEDDDADADAEADRVEEVTALIERIEELSGELQSFAADLQL